MAGSLPAPSRPATGAGRQRLRQLGWLLAIWAAGVMTLGAVAAMLRLLTGVAGLTR
jgi:uncharacterized protein DUF2474